MLVGCFFSLISAEFAQGKYWEGLQYARKKYMDFRCLFLVMKYTAGTLGADVDVA